MASMRTIGSVWSRLPARLVAISAVTAGAMALAATGCTGESAPEQETTPTSETGSNAPGTSEAEGAGGVGTSGAGGEMIVETEGGTEPTPVASGASAGGAGSVTVDPGLPVYEPDERVSGSLKFAGSDTMTNLVGLWVATFNRVHPAVNPQAEAKGSSTAPPALIEGQAQFGAMSREMKPEETQKFVEEFGFEPTQLRVAIDAIGIFVNKDNPIESITLDQLTEAFSVTGGDLTWGDLGLTDPDWVNLPVSLYGRNEASGTYGFFQKVGLGGADYKPTVKAQPGSAGVVGAVSNDRGGLGYSGLGYRTADIRIIPLAVDEYSEAVTPDTESVSSGEYPLARFLYMYLRHDRREAIDPLRAEFIRMVFSRDGQEAVVQDGVYPITAGLAREQLESLGIEPGF